jgi:hypothetical protein
MEYQMSNPSDGISIHEISTGGQNAGNGGEGYNEGDVYNNPNINFNPSNFAIGASVESSAGSEVSQTATWDAGGATGTGGTAFAGFGIGGLATGGEGLSVGADTSAVTANTTATQTNFLSADMHQTVLAGNGGNGGSGNYAHGGDVRLDPVSVETTTTTLSNLLNHAENFSVDDFSHIV